MIIIAILLSISDIITTLFITTHGGVELNPLAQVLSLPVFIAIKIFLTIGLIVWAILMYKWKIKDLLINVIIILFCAIYLLALINNVGAIICHYMS